jgi:alkylation response protein AidB-like acyl-CoA dehydrogenase
VADLYARLRVYRVNGLRALDAMHRGTPGAESSIGKLLSCPLLEDMADFAANMHGLGGQLTNDDGQPSQWLKLAYQARGTSIAGGTTFIQRNIAAERVLGLPRG